MDAISRTRSRSLSRSILTRENSVDDSSGSGETALARHDVRTIGRGQVHQCSFIIPDRQALAKALRVTIVNPQLPGMTEFEFRRLARAHGLPEALCDALIISVADTVVALTQPSVEDLKLIERARAEVKDFTRLPVDRSLWRQCGTMAAAGASAYLSSFFSENLPST